MIIRSKKELDQAFKLAENQAYLMLDSGKTVSLEVGEFKKKRTNEANAYYWLFNSWVAEFLNDSGLSYGEHSIPYTGELIHEIQKKLFGIITTTKMSVSEFCQYINRITVFWQEKTCGEFTPKELPISYLERKGYDFERNSR